jgi:Glutaredoxin-like domain (DUF836)
MLAALEALRSDYRFTLEVVDIDADEALVAKYDELVPVLLASKRGAQALQICHYFIDQSKVKALFDESG